jgi:hypothetical protein
MVVEEPPPLAVLVLLEQPTGVVEVALEILAVLVALELLLFATLAFSVAQAAQ